MKVKGKETTKLGKGKKAFVTYIMNERNLYEGGEETKITSSNLIFRATEIP